MPTESPPTRRKFAHRWDEVDYLYGKLLYWFYDRQEPRRALPFAQRLERLLRGDASDLGAIFVEECRSLIAELAGDLPEAIAHRESEIRLIRRLHEMARNTPHERFVLGRYGYDDLRDRLDLLATLYHDNGDLDKAIAALQESQQLCKRHGIKYDGRKILQEYTAEKAAQNGASQSA